MEEEEKKMEVEEEQEEEDVEKGWQWVRLEPWHLLAHQSRPRTSCTHSQLHRRLLIPLYTESRTHVGSSLQHRTSADISCDCLISGFKSSNSSTCFLPYTHYSLHGGDEKP